MDGLYRDEPATPEQLAGALATLGGYTGTGDAAEHAAEAERLGAGPYRMQLANALLGAAQVEALLCEQLGAGELNSRLGPTGDRRAVHIWKQPRVE